MNRIEGLDTLRFFAFFSVYIFHVTPNFTYGYLGVNFFFVLSSFLLTYLALMEIDKNGFFSRTNFFLRRAIRIFPLYYSILIFSFFILPLISHYYHFNISLPKNKLLYLFFLSNYEVTDCLFYLKFYWSIAVEEQFYLLFIIFGFLLKRHLISYVLLLLICYILFMNYATYKNISTYQHTIAHLSEFSFGMLSAYVYHKKTNILPMVLFSLFLSMIVILFFKNNPLNQLALSVVFADLILITTYYGKHFSRLPILRWIESLGKYTYGLYVYSGIIITIFVKFIKIENSYLSIIAQLTILILVSYTSYHLFEKRFLRLRSVIS
jgi:peptidoglycan/LPS O-acetylase OafA/YrhL